MGADPLSPIAPARVRVLVLPAGRIKRHRFMTFVERLQKESTVRLGDISPDGSSDRTMFSPMAFPNGALLYHFSAAMPPPSNLALTPFELFREPVMVLGIVDAEECEGSDAGTNGGLHSDTKEELENVADRLREQYPKILVHQLLVMDCSTDGVRDWLPAGAICVSAQRMTRSTSMKTAMCDISAKFLSELTTYARAVQALPSVQSPGFSPGAGPVAQRTPADRSSSLRGIDSRTSSPVSDGRPLHADALSRTVSASAATGPGGSRSTSPPMKPPVSFDDLAGASMNGNASTRSVSRTERDGSRTASRDRMSMQAFGSSNTAERARNKGKARVGIVIGNLYMMAGRWSDAWRELVENTNKSRIASDYIWYAKGLESVLVCMLLFIWTGYDFTIPAICYSNSDRPLSLIGLNSVKDGLPSLGAQEPGAAKEAAQRLAKLLPELIPTILGIHERASTTGGDTLPPVAYSESIIRMAKLLAVIQNANGLLDSTMVGKMVSGRPPSGLPSTNVGYTAGISKTTIAELLFRAYPPPSANVPLPDETKIMAGIASVLSVLGLERKKAIVTKELVAALVPALVQARKVGAAEMGIHPAASLSAAFDVPVGDQQTALDGLLKEIYSVYGAQRSNEPFSSHEGTLGANGSTSLAASVTASISAAMSFADSQIFGSLNLKIDILRACIDFCEALPDLPGIVHFAALLLRIAGPQSALLPSMTQGRVRLATEEQIRLISNMSRTSNAANKTGLQDTMVPYWDDFLVRNMQWLDNENAERLREHQRHDVNIKSLPQPSTPFLYDPSAKKDQKTEEKVIVAGEQAELTVTLQNPFDFEVKIEKLAFATEGVTLEVAHAQYILGPARIQTFAIPVRAKHVGHLTIVGCLIKVSGCLEQVFPVYPGSWSAEEPIKVKELGLSIVSEGHLTQALEPAQCEQINGPVPFTLSSTVIHAQPHVVLDSTSLSESALMALEGQKKTFQVTLRNTSLTRSVDFLHVSFEDSLTSSIRTALSNKDLTRAEMYELESQLSKDPVLVWAGSNSGSAQSIPPGAKSTFDITVVGRPGLGAAKIMFDYAYLGQPLSELEGRAYTRQIVVPIDITVNASVQLHRIDFAEFPSDFAWSNQHRHRHEDRSSRLLSRRSSFRPVEKSSDRFRALLDRVGIDSDDEDHCLVLLDLRNAWPNPLTVSVEVLEAVGSARSSTSSSSMASDNKSDGFPMWKRAYTVHEVIHPGHIARLVLLLPRIQISNPHAPIPLLSHNQRQFVVNADKVVSHDFEIATREKFWFREEVLRHLRGSWKEDGTARQGAVDLRGIRLSPRMIDMMRLQDVDVSMNVIDAGSGDLSPETEETPSVNGEESSTSLLSVIQLGRSNFQVRPEAFLILRTTIKNRSTTPIRAVLRLQPTLAHQASPELALDIGKKLMISGLLQQALPTIPPMQSVNVELGICPVVSGEFDVHALVEELEVPAYNMADIGDPLESDRTNEDFSVGGQGLKPRERRIWRAGEACRLVVSDVDH